MIASPFYVIKTDLPPEDVTRISVELFAKWMMFALGWDSLGGRRLVYPTGRYAASLRYEQRGESTVAIVADENVAPEALWLEVGHGAFDMKTVKSLEGRAIPMHRAPGGSVHLARTGLRRIGAPHHGQPSMWAEVRRAGASGFASFGPNSDPESWIIPAMPAYAPARVLAELGARLASMGRP